MSNKNTHHNRSALTGCSCLRATTSQTHRQGLQRQNLYEVYQGTK